MRSGSKTRLVVYYIVIGLLGINSGVLLQIAGRRNPSATVRTISPTLIAGEGIEKDPPRASGKEPPPLDEKLVKYVRSLSYLPDYDAKVEKQIRQLVEMGEKVFPAYEAILADTKSRSHEVASVLSLLREVKADRRGFRKYAVARLADARDGVVLNAVQLLEVIGGPAEASPLVALLSDRDLTNSFAAAKALAAIGGPNEVVAMDVWLRGDSHRGDRQLREDVQKYRDDLKKCLDAKKARKKKEKASGLVVIGDRNSG